MMMRTWTVLVVTIVVLLCLAPSPHKKVTTIPEMRLQIVDDATGEPQEMAMIHIWAGKKHVSPYEAGVEWYDYYINNVYFLPCKEGWVTLQASSFSFMDQSYSGCHINIESPLHQRVELSCKALCQMKTGKHGVQIRLKAIEDRLMLSYESNIIYAGMGKVVDPYEQRVYEMLCREKIMTNWDQYTKGEPEFVRKGALISCADGYILRADPCFQHHCSCQPYDGVSVEECRQLQSRAIRFYCRLLEMYPVYHDDLLKMRNYSMFDQVNFKEGRCVQESWVTH